MQDEPEPRAGFSFKMRLKEKLAMLGFDHQHGLFGSNEPGADPGMPGWQRPSAVCRATARASVRLGGEDAGAASVRQPGSARQGADPALHSPDDRFEPGTGDAPDRGLSQDGPGESGGLSAH